MKVEIIISETIVSLLRLLQINEGRRVTNIETFEQWEIDMLISEGCLKAPKSNLGAYILTPLAHNVKNNI